MKSYLFLLAFLSFPSLVLAAGACKAPQLLNQSHMTPQGIQGWLRTVGSKVKTVQDFVCCLPEEYRSNYMVGHSSVAGQNGTPASPRVIMMNNVDNRKGRPLQMLLSFNGGEKHMSGGKSIEIAFHNPRNKEVEYFDLEFDEIRGKHLSNKNPETCMNCHGQDGKAPAGGAKMIFDIFNDWHRFVGGVNMPCNSDEDKLKKIVEDQAVESVRSNPQYGCLDKSKLEKDEKGEYSQLVIPLADLDNSMSGGISETQRKKWGRSIPELDKYQYFMGASLFCGGKITEWMSPEIYRRNFANLDIDPRLKKDGSLERVFKEALADEDQKVLEFRKKQKDLIRNRNAGKPMMAINRSGRACLETRGDDEFFKEYENDLIARAQKEDSKFYANRDPLLLLELDNYLRGPRLQSRSLPGTTTRFALEGEGIGTYMIQKSFRPGELVHGNLPFDEAKTPAPVRELADMMFGKKPNNPEKKKQLCAEIKELSRASLSSVKGSSSTRSGSR